MLSAINSPLLQITLAYIHSGQNNARFQIWPETFNSLNQNIQTKFIRLFILSALYSQIKMSTLSFRATVQEE
jgi:hypothetical protein